MAARVRGHKPKIVGVRLTERQFNKLENMAIAKDVTISEVMREIVDSLRVEFALPYQNSNTSGLILPDAPAGIAR